MSLETWLDRELILAYLDARKGKLKTQDEMRFELNEMENLLNLREAILRRTYRPGRGIAFIVDKPVMREIFAAPFRDRVVHHLLFNAVADWWDRRLIADCYSCRPGKGTDYGIRRLAKNIRRASENYTKSAYVIKLDIQGYFMSLPRKALFERVMWGLDRQYPEKGGVYEILKFLWARIIFDDPTKNVLRRGDKAKWATLPKSKSLFYQPPGKGIVIGNLSSQLLSNIYLDKLDRYVTGELGYKYYGRYVDDFYIVVEKAKYAQAKADVAKIEQLLKEMGLVLHPKKRYYQEINKGVSFLGKVVYPGRIVAGQRVRANFYRAAEECVAGKRDPESIISYLGLLKHYQGQALTKRVFEHVGWL